MSVLTVVTKQSEAVALARFGYHLARAVEEKLVVLWIEQGVEDSAPLTLRPGDEVPATAPPAVTAICRDLARGEHHPELDEAHAETPEDEPLLVEPEVAVVSLTARYRLRAVLERVETDGVVYLLVSPPRERSRLGGAPLARKLFTAAPCHTLLVRLDGAEARSCRRILIPTAGGPHADVALRLGAKLAAARGGEATALYVEPEAGDLAEEVGDRLLGRALDAAKVASSRFLKARTVLADGRTEGIARVAAEGYDLLLLGASNVGALRGQLFGTVPDRLLQGETGLIVAVVRRRRKLAERALAHLGRWLDLTVPQMSRDQRIALYEKLQSGSEWSFDFMALMCLSTAIATLGLLQSSGAVVIGAMLVAPLMTPILGAGLALLQGNPPLLRAAARALAFGYLMALAIGYLLGLSVPIPELTPELLARGGPTLLDMGVAFCAGFAAAYCLGRPGLLAALPGVAIAAALVPPIATTGVSLARGATGNARGAALLFGTNVVAIVLGAAASLYAGGIRGRRGATASQRWVRFTFVALLLGAALLALPLGSGLLSQITGRPRLGEDVRAAIEARVERHEGVRLLELKGRREEGGQVVEIVVRAGAPVSEALAGELAAAVHEALGEGWTVRVRTEVAVEVGPL